MKKFSNLNNNDIITNVDTKTDIIKMLIDESIKIENGEITGKDKLVNAIEKLIQISESKSAIKTLETVTTNSYKKMDLAWISESIETQKKHINSLINPQVTIEIPSEKLMAKKNGIAINENFDQSYLTALEEEQNTPIINRSNFTKTIVIESKSEDLSGIYESIMNYKDEE